ncbi:MAG: TlpA family protein disulfide reductase [Planctomycetes bacterium]|nr:TlpA family protein disulfide reductase [Planctomycetota bacterium]
MPKLLELRDRYQDQGLVLIGIHTQNGADEMAGFVAEAKIDYPVAADREGKTVAAFAVDSFPDYYVIDRSGKLRFADLANAELERAVKFLLAEKAAPVATPWSEALTEAARRRKRVLVTTLGEEELGTFRSALARDRELAGKLGDEYRRYDLHRGGEPRPAGHPGALDAAPAALVVFDDSGRELARRAWADLHGDQGLDLVALRGFLTENALPHPDAGAHFAAALERARREDKRLLVHLGAPW